MNQIEKLNIIKKYINENSELNKFSFYPWFKQLWYQKMEHSLESDKQILYSTRDILYYYEYHSGIIGYDVSLNLSIDMLLHGLEHYPKLFPVINLDNKDWNLYYGEYRCHYNYYEEKDCKNNYDNQHNIVIAPRMTLPIQYVMIDGNHRISKLLRKEEKIKVRLCPVEVLKILPSSIFEKTAISCLYDCLQVRNNLGKINDFEIAEKLKIFQNLS